MAVGMLVQIPGGTQEFYESVMSNLDWDNAPKPAGFISHHAAVDSDGLVVFDTWESQQDWENFAQGRLGEAMGAATGGDAPQVQPRFVQILREDHA
jgi:hypothetical protein